MLGCAMSAAFLTFALVTQTRAVTEEWVRTAPFPPYTYGAMVALDPAGNVVATGHVPLASDLVTTKYDPDGNEIWQVHYTMPDYELVATWVTVDGDGNVIVTGYPQSFSSNPVPIGLLTVKYDAAGTFLWDDLVSATWGFSVRSLVDDANNIYVTGRGWFGTYDFVTIKYDPTGAVLWLDIFDQNGGFHTPTAMDLDDAGNLIVTGGGISGGLITVLYDSTGNRQWVIERSGSAGGSVRFTGDGHFYLTGSLYSPPTSNDILLQKIDMAGQLTWERFYDFGGSELGRRLTIDSHGNVVVAGFLGMYTNWLTLETDPNGTLLWSQIYDEHPANDEMPNFILTGPDDEVYVTGFGGPPAIEFTSYLQMVTVRYDANGTEAWSQTHYVWASRGMGLALGDDRSVYVVGLGNSITTIKYSQPPAVGVPGTPALDGALTLRPPSPNPFRGEVAVHYSLPRGEHVRLGVFDLAGRRVAALVDRVQGSGEHREVWTGRNTRGDLAPPGVYIVRMRAGATERAEKVSLVP
jgi:hypothetical protein